jgi:Fur family zinc uptake transcriptional regulator
MSERLNHSSAPSNPDAQAALNKAEALCRQRGVRWTALRRRVLEIILNNPGPVGAYDILAVLQREQGRTAPPTVYRVLDFLLEQNLVHRLTSLSAYLVCSHPQDHHSAQFMICKQCGKVTELADNEIKESVVRSASTKDFEVEDQVIEIKGRCRRCRRR